MEENKTYDQLLEQVEDLKWQLEEANDALNAIRTGQVDALIVSNENGHKLYTLKSADQTYRVFIENMNEGAITLNKNGIILYSNTRFAQMIDLPLSQVIGSELRSFIPVEAYPSFDKLINKGWNSENKAEQLLVRADNSIVPFLLSLKILELDEGTELSIILTDLSTQKEAERELKLKNELLEAAHTTTARLNMELERKVEERTRDLLTSREHFKFLADNIPVIVWTALPNGELNYYNKKWYDFTGTSFEESKGWGWTDMIHPEDVERSKNSWSISVNTGTAFSTEFRYKRASDASYRWHYVHALPFRNNQNEIIAWFGISSDIEDQKMAMQKKDDFISIVSHELKTPLTSVKAYIQLAMANTQPIPGQMNQYIEKADQFTRKLEYLINDIMDVSKIQAGKLQFTIAQVNINKLVSSCIENAKILYPAVNFIFEAGHDLFVSGNYERLEQVVLNLINNAVKYSPGSDEIIVAIKDENDVVRVLVKDFGIGLNPDQKDRIFDRFYRIANVSSAISGLGMGLYISSEIIKAHKGSIGVESKLHKGSTFYFTLPKFKI